MTHGAQKTIEHSGVCGGLDEEENCPMMQVGDDRLMRLVVLISGNGTNLQAVLDACAARELPGEVVAVISNRRAAYGLVRAERAGVPAVYRPLKAYTDRGRSRVDYDRDLADVVAGYAPDLVVLAGWMHVLSPDFIARFAGRLINLHPALPGMFAGTHAIERAYTAFRQGEIEVSGVMVHHVVPEVDAGPLVDWAVVPLRPDESLDDFEERMHTSERIVLVRAIGRVLGELHEAPAHAVRNVTAVS